MASKKEGIICIKVIRFRIKQEKTSDVYWGFCYVILVVFHCWGKEYDVCSDIFSCNRE